MVCELQLLLAPMIDAKKKDHALYEIQRTREYRKNVSKLSTLYSTPEEEILAIAMRQDVKGMEAFIINHPNFDYLAPHDAVGFSLIHYIVEQGNVKMMKFLVSYVPSEKVETLLNLGGGNSRTPLIIAAEGGQLDMAKVKRIMFKISLLLLELVFP